MREIAAVVVGSQIVHKEAVELDDVGREVLDVGERRLTRAEIVQGDPDSHLPQLLQPRRDGLGAVDGESFVDLENETAGWYRGLVQQLLQEARRLRISKGLDRLVDGDPFWKLALLPPDRLGEGLLEHPPVQLADDAASLGGANELALFQETA